MCLIVGQIKGKVTAVNFISLGQHVADDNLTIKLSLVNIFELEIWNDAMRSPLFQIKLQPYGQRIKNLSTSCVKRGES